MDAIHDKIAKQKAAQKALFGDNPLMGAYTQVRAAQDADPAWLHRMVKGTRLQLEEAIQAGKARTCLLSSRARARLLSPVAFCHRSRLATRSSHARDHSAHIT